MFRTVATLPPAWAAAFALACVHCGERADSRPMTGPPPAAVEIVTVEPTQIRDIVDMVGALEAEESVLIKPETRGVIESVVLEEGAEVTKGTVLFRLRDAEQQARLRESEANLVLAEDEYKRAKTLAMQGTMSAAEFERTTAQWRGAEARRDLARIELERMQIRAPFDGVLGARRVSPGDRVNTDTPLIQIDALTRLRVVFSLPEMAVAAARVGTPLEINVVSLPGEQFAGEVYFVAPSLEPTNRRLLLKAWVPNEARKLRPGFFANIKAEVAKRDAALVVPESAIAYDAGGAFVWRVSGHDVAERVGVTLGIRREGQVEIVSGLSPGERIVSAGVHKVAPGAKVQLAASVPPTAASGETP